MISIRQRYQTMIPQSIVVHILNNNTLRYYSLIPLTYTENEGCNFFSGNLMKILEKKCQLPFLDEHGISHYDASDYYYLAHEQQ